MKPKVELANEIEIRAHRCRIDVKYVRCLMYRKSRLAKKNENSFVSWFLCELNFLHFHLFTLGKYPPSFF